MSAADKARNKVDTLVGETKEKTGRATRNPRMEDEGRGDRVKGHLKDAGQNITDAFRR